MRGSLVFASACRVRLSSSRAALKNDHAKLCFPVLKKEHGARIIFRKANFSFKVPKLLHTSF